MKAIIYREVDVSNICKYCGYPLDVSTHLCLHCRIEENLKKNDFVSRKALWSDECFTKNFHHGIASILNFSKLQKYASNMHQIQETAQNSFIHYAI